MPKLQDIKNEVLLSLRNSLSEIEYKKLPQELLESVVNFYIEKQKLEFNQDKILNHQNDVLGFLNDLQKSGGNKPKRGHINNLYQKLNSYLITPLSALSKQLSVMNLQNIAPWVGYGSAAIGLVGDFIPSYVSLKKEMSGKMGEETFINKSLNIITAALLFVSPAVSLFLYAGKALAEPIIAQWFSKREKLTDIDKNIIVQKCQEVIQQVNAEPELSNSLQKAMSIKSIAEIAEVPAKDLLVYNPSVSLLDELKHKIVDEPELKNVIKNAAAFSRGFFDLHSKDGSEVKNLLEDISKRMKKANFSDQEINKMQEIIRNQNELGYNEAMEYMNNSQDRQIASQIIKCAESTKNYLKRINNESISMFPDSIAKTKLIQQILKSTLEPREKSLFSLLKTVSQFAKNSTVLQDFKGKLGLNKASAEKLQGFIATAHQLGHRAFR